MILFFNIFFIPFKQLYTSCKIEQFCYKVGVVYVAVRVSRCLIEELAYATDKRLRVISNICVFKNSLSAKELKELKNKVINCKIAMWPSVIVLR